MDRTTARLAFGATKTPVGQAEYLTPGTYSLTVPLGVTTMSAVVVNGGSDGTNGDGGTDSYGGAGGNLRWISSFAVTGGETLTVSVGYPGGATSIKRGATVLLSGYSTVGGSIGGGNGGGGGTATAGAGGGGAGGYSGTGGGGGGDFNQAGPGNGGGGGGGEMFFNNALGPGGMGGGVGLHGEGASGPRGTEDFGNYDGGQGSVTPGVAQVVGYGGAGGGLNGGARGGGNGGARVIWGEGRAYPSTRTTNET